LKLILILLLAFVGCAQVTSLNLKKHQFGLQPTKIVIFQIAGLHPEHLAMLRFSAPTIADVTALENSMCTGVAWSFNLYSLRPKSHESMLAQLTGKKDIKGECSDYQHQSLWSLLGANYKTAILEIGARDEESLLASKNCHNEAQDFTSRAIFWTMRPQMPKQAKEYVPSVAQKFESGEVYWDKTCRMQGCGASIRTSLSSLYSQYQKNVPNQLIIVRDFSFKHEIDRKNFNGAREVLSELDKAIEAFYSMARQRSDMLVVVSGAGSIDLDFPHQGKEWQRFDLKGSDITARRGELWTPVFAVGARAENFCGFYEENHLLERILSGPKQQGLELKVINPFN
jgi:hypothetical protein